MVFSDSDSEMDNDGSTITPNESPTSGGDVQPMAALSAVSTVFARQRSGDKKGETAVLGNKQADSSSDAVSVEVSLGSSTKANGPASPTSKPEEVSSSYQGAATTASKEGRQGLPSYQDALAAGAAALAAGAAAEAEADAGPEAKDKRSTAGAAAPAEGEGRGAVEPSPAPRNYSRFASSTLPSTTAVLAGGGGSGVGRPRSTALGRPGMQSAKVAMPIAGGRAAWSKFLATTTQGESEEPAAAAADGGDGEREKEGGDASSADGDKGVGASGSKAGNVVAAASGNHAATLAAKGPRGFTSPAQSQEGPNKGPAGAFSGNSMWRLAGGTSAAATRSGVAANGHGGYSNPLAAMRAAGNGGGAETSSGGGAGGGGVVNPLAGLRGATGMGGAGVSNPLARGRGPRAGGSRAGGGMANPMLRNGGGDMGGLARGAGGVGTTSRTLPPPPPRGDEGSLSPGPATMPPLSSSPSGVGGAPAIPATRSWGPSLSSINTTAAAAAGDDGDATEAAASTGGGGGNAAMRRGRGSERPPTEFRAIGSNGSWPRDGALVPPMRRAARGAQRPSETEPDPGQEKVGGLVVSATAAVCHGSSCFAAAVYCSFLNSLVHGRVCV